MHHFLTKVINLIDVHHHFRLSVNGHLLYKSETMRINMTNLDRTIRFLIGVAIILLNAFSLINPGIGMILMIIAVTLLVTTYTGYCPFYWLFGHNNARTRAK